MKPILLILLILSAFSASAAKPVRPRSLRLDGKPRAVRSDKGAHHYHPSLPGPKKSKPPTLHDLITRSIPFA